MCFTQTIISELSHCRNIVRSEHHGCSGTTAAKAPCHCACHKPRRLGEGIHLTGVALLSKGIRTTHHQPLHWSSHAQVSKGSNVYFLSRLIQILKKSGFRLIVYSSTPIFFKHYKSIQGVYNEKIHVY